MNLRILSASVLFLLVCAPAWQADAQGNAGLSLTLQASTAAAPRYSLGAVVDVRQASANGVTLLAVTPGGAADRMGLRAGDQLRAVNGSRLQGSTRPASALEEALQDSGGDLQVEAWRDGKALSVAGRADVVARAAGSGGSCGYVSAKSGVPPRSQNIFLVEITQVDGKSTPLQPFLRYKVPAGKHVLVVREFIDRSRLNSSQQLQIVKMQRQELARAYKSLVVDVQPGKTYRIGARLHKDRLDAKSIRANAYWEPVVWESVAEACP